MKKIAFHCSSSGRNEDGMLEQFKYLTPNHSGVWKDIQGVPNIKDADYYIVLEDFDKGFPQNYDTKKVIYFQGEPNGIRTNRNSPSYYDTFFAYYDYDNYHFPPFWSSRIPFNEAITSKYPTKRRELSCVMSTKLHKKMIGYSQRQNFLMSFVDSFPNIIDVFGRGRIGKELNYNDTCSKRGYEDYKYTLSTENCSISGHATDRIYDSIINWCVPIYWGMSNISKLGLPKGSYHKFNILGDEEQIISIMKENPITQKTIKVLQKARKIIMFKLNFWEKIYQTLKDK